MDKSDVPIVLALVLTVALGLRYQLPIGADIHYHLTVAESLAGGNPSHLFSSSAMPYPPLLHLILVPSVWLNTQLQFSVFLQVLLLPLAVFAITRLFSGDSRVIVGLTVLSSIAFVDRVLQVNPQALDFILFPLALYYGVVKPDNRVFIVCSALMLWNHSFAAVASLGGLFIWKLAKQQWKPLLWILLLTLPIVVSSVWLFPRLVPLLQLGVFENAQEQQFWANPLLFTLPYLGLPIIGLLCGPYKWLRDQLSDLDIVCILSLASLTIMLLPWADRFVQYSTIPLAVLATSLLARLRAKWGNVTIVPVILWFLYTYATLWIWLLENSYYVVS